MEKTKWRKNQFNDEYFNDINTEDKAYFLGFLWADGNNFFSGWSGKVSIKLSEKDKYILEKFKSFIGYTNPLQHIKNITCKDKNGKIHYCQDAYSLNLNSLKMATYMNSIGLHPNKTNTLRLPLFNIVPKYLFHHWIRGFFDGDGSISKRIPKGRNFPRFTLEIAMKNLDLLNDFLKYIPEFINIPIKFRKNCNIYKLYISKMEHQISFLEWMYKDSNIYLYRKYERFLELKERKNYAVAQTT